jgi:hypothetical protein
VGDLCFAVEWGVLAIELRPQTAHVFERQILIPGCFIETGCLSLTLVLYKADPLCDNSMTLKTRQHPCVGNVLFSYMQVLSECGWETPGKDKRRNPMQVLLKSAETAVETRCSVCGQGFVMFWERQTKMEKSEALRQIETTLRHHHHQGSGSQAHPAKGFLVPEWNGPIAFSGAAILGNAPAWAL